MHGPRFLFTIERAGRNPAHDAVSIDVWMSRFFTPFAFEWMNALRGFCIYDTNRIR
jgi:hypothetical protein